MWRRREGAARRSGPRSGPREWRRRRDSYRYAWAAVESQEARRDKIVSPNTGAIDVVEQQALMLMEAVAIVGGGAAASGPKIESRTHIPGRRMRRSFFATT